MLLMLLGCNTFISKKHQDLVERAENSPPSVDVLLVPQEAYSDSEFCVMLKF